MKKHILGFALFSLILFLTVLIYMFFVPQIEVIKKPAYETWTRKPCENLERPGKVSLEIVSAQFDLDSHELITQLKLKWNGYGELPQSVFISSRLFYSGNTNPFSSDSLREIEEPFKDSIEKTFIRKEKVLGNIDEKLNLYVVFDASDNIQCVRLTEDATKFAKMSPVLFVHGDSSIIKK